jgi:hypothetical protein
MTYLAGKPKEDNSMSLKRVSQKVCMALWPASPVRMVKLNRNSETKRGMLNPSSATAKESPAAAYLMRRHRNNVKIPP